MCLRVLQNLNHNTIFDRENATFYVSSSRRLRNNSQKHANTKSQTMPHNETSSYFSFQEKNATNIRRRGLQREGAGSINDGAKSEFSQFRAPYWVQDAALAALERLWRGQTRCTSSPKSVRITALTQSEARTAHGAASINVNEYNAEGKSRRWVSSC